MPYIVTFAGNRYGNEKRFIMVDSLDDIPSVIAMQFEDPSDLDIFEYTDDTLDSDYVLAEEGIIDLLGNIKVMEYTTVNISSDSLAIKVGEIFIKSCIEDDKYRREQEERRELEEYERLKSKHEKLKSKYR